MAREMKTCENGHLYNPQAYERCPYCYGEDANKQVNVTMPAKEEEEEITPTVAGNYGAYAKEERRSFYEEEDDERTVAAYFKETGIDPVVGWLVALNGPYKGTDYRIHSDNNYIGRSRSMSICIHGDDTISKENHASIAYETRSRKFYFTPGTGRNIVRVNDNAIFATIELKAYDIIELGVTSFVFIPFCSESFDWNQTLVQEGEVQ